ncbi:MAG: type II secretion system protein, partial [bacterium]
PDYKNLNRRTHTGPDSNNLQQGTYERGFTLIELLAVIVILGIVTVTVGIKLDWMSVSSGRELTRLQNTLRFQQARSLKTGKEIMLRFRKKQGDWILIRKSDSRGLLTLTRWRRTPDQPGNILVSPSSFYSSAPLVLQSGPKRVQISFPEHGGIHVEKNHGGS